MALTDPQMVKEALSGGAEAFGEIVDRYKGAVYAVVYAVIGDFDAVDDLAQETFVRAYRSLGELRDPAKLPSWLMGIASHVSLDYVRRRKREGDAFGKLKNEKERQGAPEAGGAGAAGDIGERLKRVIAELPEDCRTALMLRFYDERSYAEIAGLLDIPVSTVRGQIYRGMQHLRTRLKGGGA